MGHEITTDDLLVLRSIEGKMELRDEKLDQRLDKFEERLRRIERAHPGGATGKLLERAILVVLTALLGWQNIQPKSDDKPETKCVVEAPAFAPKP